MKKSFLIIIIIGAISIAVAAYWLGYTKGTQYGLGICRGGLYMELGALQDIRANKTEEAISNIETHCFAMAAVLLGSPRWRNSGSVKTIMPDFVKYRSQYRPNESEWTPMEKILNNLLIEQHWKNREPSNAPYSSPAAGSNR